MVTHKMIFINIYGKKAKAAQQFDQHQLAKL